MIRNRFVVEVADTKTLDSTINRLRNIESVFDAYRVTPGAALSAGRVTTSKSRPVSRSSACSWSLSQRGSGAPLTYHGEPLSASISP